MRRWYMLKEMVLRTKARPRKRAISGVFIALDSRIQRRLTHLRFSCGRPRRPRTDEMSSLLGVPASCKRLVRRRAEAPRPLGAPRGCAPRDLADGTVFQCRQRTVSSGAPPGCGRWVAVGCGAPEGR